MNVLLTVLTDVWYLWADLFTWLPYSDVFAVCTLAAALLTAGKIIRTVMGSTCH